LNGAFIFCVVVIPVACCRRQQTKSMQQKAHAAVAAVAAAHIALNGTTEQQKEPLSPPTARKQQPERHRRSPPLLSLEIRPWSKAVLFFGWSVVARAPISFGAAFCFGSCVDEAAATPTMDERRRVAWIAWIDRSIDRPTAAAVSSTDMAIL
jgi:hypothetical protein